MLAPHRIRSERRRGAVAEQRRRTEHFLVALGVDAYETRVVRDRHVPRADPDRVHLHHSRRRRARQRDAHGRLESTRLGAQRDDLLAHVPIVRSLEGHAQRLQRQRETCRAGEFLIAAGARVAAHWNAQDPKGAALEGGLEVGRAQPGARELAADRPEVSGGRIAGFPDRRELPQACCYWPLLGLTGEPVRRRFEACELALHLRRGPLPDVPRRARGPILRTHERYPCGHEDYGAGGDSYSVCHGTARMLLDRPGPRLHPGHKFRGRELLRQIRSRTPAGSARRERGGSCPREVHSSSPIDFGRSSLPRVFSPRRTGRSRTAGRGAHLSRGLEAKGLLLELRAYSKHSPQLGQRAEPQGMAPRQAGQVLSSASRSTTRLAAARAPSSCPSAQRSWITCMPSGASSLATASQSLVPHELPAPSGGWMT